MINIKSDSFNDGDIIPKKFTCDDMNISPQLQWDLIPDDSKSLAILCEDPDAPSGLFTHWIIFNIPSDVNEIPENVEKKENLENGAVQGTTSYGSAGYRGPCPPQGPAHRYFFRIYALDNILDLGPLAEREEFLNAIEGHILDEGILIGKYRG
ncbi:YbhB/YbcL family Raf kinase inhibitor-like protein [Methanobacterium sp. ACI-7]|uniref:YbhB/YbcL family Raf kinase inhibitor-like protein n=1 Tax=unclassified Methanobacterium TaxID=2627676 RepID=UPI0039C31B73